ncbi:NACHT domain-containing protein [Paractinoplanes maris]|uniref:NACHT domain-containing protein n=1 Tax=Paractinoplanes maris TaxID=1734446 RepID=UPI002021C619|nr:NACHT domain-containing protein [Actinoplanes maris]
MADDLKALSIKVVENALKVLIPSSGDRIEGIAGLIANFRAFGGDRTKPAVTARLYEAADAISERMERHTAVEFRQLSMAERRLAIEGVLSAMDGIGGADGTVPLDDLSTDRIVTLGLPAAEHAWSAALLSEDARNYGRIFLSHACDYIVALVKGFPDFDERVRWETYVLARRLEESLATSIASVVPPLTAILPSDRDIDSIEASHRSRVALRYRTIDLFGLGLPTDMRRQSIDVAYVHLRGSYPRTMFGGQLGRQADPARPETEATMMDEALADAFDRAAGGHSVNLTDEFLDDGTRKFAYTRYGARIVLAGGAGSGKTTISRWLAVRVATGKLPRALQATLGRCVPFYVPLRTLMKNTAHPTVDDLLGPQSPAVRPAAQKWLRRCLRDGHALVILDGLDELPEAAKGEVESWLTSMIKEYPASHFFATSRPEGLSRQWFATKGFELVELQPMEAAQARECIVSWYDALIHGGSPDKRLEYENARNRLLEDFERRPAVADLAQTPLLSAMLSALYATEKQDSVPQTRIELYARVVEALVDRRDRERQLVFTDLPSFEPKEKLRLLEAIARRMADSGLTSISIWRQGRSEPARASAYDAVDDRLHTMPTAAITADQAVRHLATRSVVFWDVGGGDGQFAHRTFQEYLAGRDYAYTGDIEDLLSHARDPAWRNTIVFAAGAAAQRVAVEIVDGLATRIEEQPRDRYLPLLLAECVGATGPLTPEVADRARTAVALVLPPRSLDEADAVAAFGDHIVTWLAHYEADTPEVLNACIHTAVRVGSPRAMAVLSRYSRLPMTVKLTGALIGAWPRFDVRSYAEQVLANLDLANLTVPVTSAETLRGVTGVGAIRRLRLQTSVWNLVPVSSLRSLESLHANGWIRSSFEGVEGLTGLRELDVRNNRYVDRIEPIAGLTELQALTLDNCWAVEDLRPLGSLRQLRFLSTAGLENVGDWDWLSALTELRTLRIDGCTVPDSAPIRSLTQLRSLFAEVRGGATDVGALAELSQLWRLRLRLSASADCTGLTLPDSLRSLEVSGRLVPAMFEAVARLPRLSTLRIVDPVGAPDLSAIARLSTLETLEIRDVRKVVNWRPLAALRSVRSLDLSGSSLGDLSFLRRMTSLETAVLDGCRLIQDLDGVEECTSLRHLSLADGVGTGLAADVERLGRRRPDLTITYDPFAIPDLGGS